ncbi:MAG: VWA domain-containing protein [Myxococcales bacterium]|nr:VWA domain-containing protein [Myxococcales bacterium]
MTVENLVIDARSPASVWASELPETTCASLAHAALAFVDTASTAFGRATAYNDRATQAAAELRAHTELRTLDRRVYARLLGLPGVTDRARQLGLVSLLGTRDPGASDEERLLLAHLASELPAPRLFKLFAGLRLRTPLNEDGLSLPRANNARTRKLVLRTLLGANRLELWSVKYRDKMAAALTHAWGVRTTSVLRAVLAKDAWTTAEQALVRRTIDRFAQPNLLAETRACVAFALRAAVAPRLPLHVAHAAAKVDLSAGAALPIEVLEGLRATFHKGVAKAEVLRVGKDSLTEGQRIRVQRRAEAAGVAVAFDPMAHDAVELYLYAFARGLTPAIEAALDAKADAVAARLGFGWDSVGVLVDASGSMAGSAEQALRPMAVTLALRDVLVRVAPATVLTVGGVSDGRLVRPSGATALAEGLVALVERSPDALFVLSDGYENQPAGRFAETVQALRAIGVQTPIYHLSPVFAAEVRGVRTLSPLASTLPVRAPAALGISFLRGLLESEPRRGLAALLALAPAPALTKGGVA